MFTNSQSRMVLGAAVGLVLMTGAAAALAQGVGNPGSLPPVIPMNHPAGWDIGGGAVGPLPVVRDPNGPKWVKTLTGPNNGPVNWTGQPYQVHEFLVIAGNLPWSDWHENILEPGWEWTPNVTFLANGAAPGGLSVVNTPSTFTTGGTLEFYFNSLPPGTVIDIFKELIYTGPVPSQFAGIRIEEYPTPEPATAVLLAAGGLLMARRRRRHGAPVAAPVSDRSGSN